MVPATFSRLNLVNIRELRAHWGRAAASVGVVAVSAALLVAVLGLSGSITGSAARLANSIASNANLEVSGVTDAGFDESLLYTVKGVTNVEAAVGMLRVQATVRSQEVLLIGVAGDVLKLHSDLSKAVLDHLQTGSPVPNGVVVGPKVGVAKGDRFDIASTPVTAILAVQGSSAQRLNDGRFVIAPLALAQHITAYEHRLDSILIVTRPGADVQQVRSDVTRVVAGRAVVAEPSFRAAQVSNSLKILQSVTLLAASTSFVLATYLSYNAMSIAIAQRRPIISTLRALGGRRRTLVLGMLSEAALLGLIGGAIGSACGILIGRIAVGRLPPTLVASVEAHVEYVLPFFVVPLAVAACVAASFTAAAFAARQVHSVAPVEALAPISVASTEAGSRPLRITAGIVGVILVAATILLIQGDFGLLTSSFVGLAFAGITALCFAFSGLILAGTTAVARLFGPVGVLAAATIARTQRRTWVAVLTVLTGVAATVAMTGADSNAVDSTVASFSSVADADAYVSATPTTIYPTAPLLPSDTEARVSTVRGVERIVPGQMAFATVGDTRLMMLGVAPGSHRKIYKLLTVRDREKFDAGEGVALSRDLSQTMGLAAGDEIALQTPTGAHRVRVLAVIPFFSGLTGTMAISLKTIREWFLRPGATNLEITVAPGFDPQSVRAAIRNTVSKDVFVYSGREALAGIRTALDTVSAVFTAIAWVVVAVSAIGLFNTLMLSVLDRRREIGVLRALGGTRRFTLGAIVAEAAAICLVGGLLGLIVGAATQYLMAIALTDVLSIDVIYRPRPAMIIIGFGALVICLLGSAPPAARAARINIVEAVGVD